MKFLKKNNKYSLTKMIEENYTDNPEPIKNKDIPNPVYPQSPPKFIPPKYDGTSIIIDFILFIMATIIVTIIMSAIADFFKKNFGWEIASIISSIIFVYFTMENPDAFVPIQKWYNDMKY
ncbi:MAG: hypothetical protein ACOCRK_04015 [bacterium]